jgi:hypothetical protein
MKYVLISTVGLSFFYSSYLLIFKNETNFRQLRFYLIVSILISLLMPVSNFRININFSGNQHTVIPDAPDQALKGNAEQFYQTSVENDRTVSNNNIFSIQHKVNWLAFLRKFYFLISMLLLTRILIQIILLTIQYFKSEKEKIEKYTIIYNDRFKNTFSFFNWIFVNKEHSLNEDMDQIISHEKIHASQYHSFDLILVELLAAVMWFNPLIWMMRNSIQLVHEYLADEGALSTGIDRLRYQALLINQVAEERLISLSSSFNKSLIKKRMIMMTKSKFNHKTKLKILTLVPLAAVLFLGVACVNGQNKNNVVTAVAPVKMNVLYLGVDNPMAIATSGYETSDLNVSIDNGTITGSNGNYIVRPDHPGSALISVSSKGKVIQKTEFRVKVVPNPVAAIKVLSGDVPDYKSEGEISKKELLTADGVVAMMQNFDFDLSFKVVSFVMSATVPDSYTVREEISKSNKFSNSQIDLIKSLVKNQKLTFEEIKVIGPDGKLRKLSPMVFTISGE